MRKILLVMSVLALGACAHNGKSQNCKGHGGEKSHHAKKKECCKGKSDKQSAEYEKDGKKKKCDKCDS